jgi:hypothetical protein
MSKSLLCNGNVLPMRAVKLDTSNAGQCLQAGASDVPFGIAQEGTRQPPLSGLDDTFAGIQGVNTITVYCDPGEECAVEAGGAITTGDYLKPSTGGVLITASSDGDVYIARAEESATASGQVIRAVIDKGFRGA